MRSENGMERDSDYRPRLRVLLHSESEAHRNARHAKEFETDECVQVKPVTYCSRFISFKIKCADCLVTTYQLGEVSKEEVDDWQILRFDARPISQRDRYAVPKAM